MVFDNNDGFPLVFIKLFQDLINPVCMAGIQLSDRLVQYQHVRSERNGSCQSQKMSLASGKLEYIIIFSSGKAAELQSFHSPLPVILHSIIHTCIRSIVQNCGTDNLVLKILIHIPHLLGQSSDIRLPGGNSSCQNLSLANFCYDLFALSPDRCLEFAPLAWHCPNRTEVWRSLKTGETDLSFQFECSEIPARGLRFTPLVYLPELCIPFNQNRPLPPGALSLEEAMCSRWIFANSFEPVLYEEELTREALSRGAEIVRGRDIPCSQYGLPTLMLTPSLFYPRPNLELVRPLGWGSGCRLGIVTRAEPDQMVLQYIQEIQPVIRTHRSQLFGLV